LKNTLFSIGFILAVGCHANLDPQSSEPLAAWPAFSSNNTIQRASKSDSEQYYNALKKFFEGSLTTRNFNGGVLIAKGDAVLYEQYTGYKDFNSKEPLDAGSPMHVASVSKTFTSGAILKLVQDGKLNLDDPISKFFPGIPYEGVTVQMLLSHRSGIPNYVHYLENMGWNKDQFATNQDVLNSLYQLHPRAEFAAGTRFSYSNTNFLLLSMIVEKVSGERFYDFMKNNIFEPLGLSNTHIFSLADSTNVIPSYQPNSRMWDWDFLDNTYGDKNVYTTPRDLFKWGKALMSGDFIRKSLLDSAFTPYSNEKKSVHNYGLGFRLLTLSNGKKVIYHNGRWHGSNAAFAMLPDEDIIIAIIGNRYNANIYSVARRSYDFFGNYLQGGPGDDDDENRATAQKVRKHSHKNYIAKRSTKRSSSGSHRSVARTR
jgi:CubicO group peptidase (beta-lactamase class C family)